MHLVTWLYNVKPFTTWLTCTCRKRRYIFLQRLFHHDPRTHFQAMMIDTI